MPKAAASDETKNADVAPTAQADPGERIRDGVASSWHPVLGIQVPLSYRLDDCDVEIWAPGNAHRWRLGELQTGDREQAEAYARLFCAASHLFDALHKIGFEPIGHPEATEREVLEAIVAVARAAIAKATAPAGQGLTDTKGD